MLDEVDAALDNTNVAKIASYIRSHASGTFQFVVISLKGSLYERSNSLVGIFRDQDVNSSRTLTLDVSPSRTSYTNDLLIVSAAHAIRRLSPPARMVLLVHLRPWYFIFLLSFLLCCCVCLFAVYHVLYERSS